MRKLFLFLLVAAGAFIFSSCSKSYTCTTVFQPSTFSDPAIVTYDKLTSAQKAAIEAEGTYSFITGGGAQIVATTTCK